MVKDTFFRTNSTLNFGGRLIDLSQPRIMGIINITPDSFYSSSRFLVENEILQQTEKHLIEGATFIDLGAISTRPNAELISEQEEINRLIPFLKILKKEFPECLISIDTFRKNVVNAAISEGANLVNDISGGGFEDDFLKIVAKHKVPYILMHNKGDFNSMHDDYDYDNMMPEIIKYFANKLDYLKKLNLTDVIIDPGFGFAKNTIQNFQLLNQLDNLKIIEKPVLVGLSRKSMIWKTLKTNADNALNGTTILNTIALLKGAQILRVHDVLQAKECIELMNHLNINKYE